MSTLPELPPAHVVKAGVSRALEEDVSSGDCTAKRIDLFDIEAPDSGAPRRGMST